MISNVKGLEAMTQEEKMKTVTKPLHYIAETAAEIGCTIGLCNHGGWFGEPENQLALINYLHTPTIGIVFNSHLAEADLDRFPVFFPKRLPHLLAVNLAGLKKGDPVTVVPIGQGDAELAMMRIVRKSTNNGPIGIINENTALDAEVGLRMNKEGLKQELRAQVTGVEFRKDLVDLCNTITEKSGIQKKYFGIEYQQLEVLLNLQK